MKRILQVITSLHIGGAEKLIVDMVPLYRKRGYDVDVLLFDGTDTPFKQRLEEQGIRIYEFDKGGSVYNPMNILKLIPFLRRYDIVHTHNTAPQLFAAFGSVLCSVVLVTTEHNTSNRRRDWTWYRPLDKWMYSRYRKVVCISDQAKENLCKYMNTERNVTTIYNGIECQQFRSAEPYDEWKNGKTIVTMVAGFRYQKDQNTLIKAFSCLPKAKYELWLVGDGERRGELEKLVSELGLKDVVRFWGIRSDIPRLLKTSDIVVMSSHFEGLSLSSIEGMSVGKPFIASDVDGLREITKDAGLLFPHGDHEALAAVIKKLAEDSDYSRQIAERCGKRAAEYDISKTVERYINIYEEVTAES